MKIPVANLRHRLWFVVLGAATIFCRPGAASSTNSAAHHPWLPPFGLERIGYEGSAGLEADALARAEKPLHPLDLGAILVPNGWLLLGPKQTSFLEVAAISRLVEEKEARLRVWFSSRPNKGVMAPFPLSQGVRRQQRVALPPAPRTVERDSLRVVIERVDGTALWQKTIPVMLVRKPPRWPGFGAVATNLRYDAPISVRDDNNTYSTLDYEKGWAPSLQDVIICLPNGARFVFWRGASYVPFWAGQNNTGLSYEWAETTPPADGFTDCVEPLMDKELRYGRVEIVESTAARIHVRWTYQSCDFKYKVWGDSAQEDFYFYPDGFGTRVLTLQSALDSNYELSEFIILTPQGAYPLSVLPANLVDILFLDGEKREILFPYDPATQGATMRSRHMPAVFRVRLHKDEPGAAVYFHPEDRLLPPVVFGGFRDAGRVVTPCYWGSHWPLARGQTTGGAINDRIHATPAHNSVMSWAMQRPPPLREARLQTVDTLGRARPMRVQIWTWLIGFSDAPDERLLEWARSFSSPPSVRLAGARLESESFAQERRAVRLIAESTAIRVTLTPKDVCVNPVFEIRQAGSRLRRVTVDDTPLASGKWAWDGRTLWINATLRQPTVLHLDFED